MKLFEECYQLRIREQLYTTSRAYWIGTKYDKKVSSLPLSTKYTSTPVIWLTPFKSLALHYCWKDENTPGILYRVKLNKYLHIFNARSAMDQALIKEILPDITIDQIKRLSSLDFYIWETGEFKGFDADSASRDK